MERFCEAKAYHVYFSGLSAVVARTSGGREVASSILVAPTNQGGKIEKIYFLYLNDADWKDFAEQKLTIDLLKKDTLRCLFLILRIRRL